MPAAAPAVAEHTPFLFSLVCTTTATEEASPLPMTPVLHAAFGITKTPVTRTTNHHSGRFRDWALTAFRCNPPTQATCQRLVARLEQFVWATGSHPSAVPIEALPVYQPAANTPTPRRLRLWLPSPLRANIVELLALADLDPRNSAKTPPAAVTARRPHAYRRDVANLRPPLRTKRLPRDQHGALRRADPGRYSAAPPLRPPSIRPVPLPTPRAQCAERPPRRVAAGTTGSHAGTSVNETRSDLLICRRQPEALHVRVFIGLLPPEPLL